MRAEESEPVKMGIAMAFNSKSALNSKFRHMAKAQFRFNKDHFQLGSKGDTKYVINFDPASTSGHVHMAFGGQLAVSHVKHLSRTALDLRGIVE